MKVGARNKMIGTVTGIKKGTLMSQVTVDIPEGVEISSVMTLDSLKELKIRKGDAVRVIVKAVNVLVVKEE